ncbi:MAG: hypothetical protein JW759_02480 [Candidatus Coatesbacteria bacterium]|nr:hypothetical protein [Candidatus Coatesbacteria bacterium]
MRPWLIALAAAAAAVAIYIVVSVLIVTDEERIETIVAQASQAIANEDLAGCMAFVNDDFIYQPKGVNKARLASIAQGIFAEADKLEVNISELQIEVDGDQATVFLSFRLLGEYVGRMDRFVGQKGFILGQPLKAAKATLILHKRHQESASSPTKSVWMLGSVTAFDPGV